MSRRSNIFRNSGLQLSIQGLGGVDASSVAVRAGQIVGHWSDPRVIDEATLRRALEQFANSRLNESEIAVFVKRFAPLFSQHRGVDDATTAELRTFSESVAEWKAEQRSLRDFWWMRIRANAFRSFKRSGQISVSDGRVIFRAHDLRDALGLSLEAIPRNRLAKCKNPGCDAPWFIRQRARQAYCGREECSAHGKRVAKLKWWHQHGTKRKARRP
jgi:hypothetical protein